MVEELPVFTLCDIHIMPNILVRVSHTTDDTIVTFVIYAKKINKQIRLNLLYLDNSFLKTKLKYIV